MNSNPIEIISKIGNYSLPAFGAFLTASFTLGKLSWPGGGERYLIIAFSMYTLFSTLVAYTHRLAWLRNRHKLATQGNDKKDLPLWVLILFLTIHGFLLFVLMIIVYRSAWLS